MTKPSNTTIKVIVIVLTVPCIGMIAECLDIADSEWLRIGSYASLFAIPIGIALFCVAEKRTAVFWAVAIFSYCRYSMT